MAEGGNKESEGGVLGRLAGRGEDALTRLMDELGRNPRVTDALGRTMAAKGKVDESTRKSLAQVGLAAAGELKELRQQLEKLEKRLSKLEASGTTGAGQSGRKPTTSTKASGGTPKKSPAASGGTRSGGSASRSAGSDSGGSGSRAGGSSRPGSGGSGSGSAPGPGS